jgi:MOSC domain
VLRGPPKILHAPGHSFSDVARKVVSIINLDSLAALADVVRAPVDPLRFRANVYVAGWPVWSELDFVGKVLAAGPRAKLKVVKRIVRCAATNVDPQTGIRDLYRRRCYVARPGCSPRLTNDCPSGNAPTTRACRRAKPMGVAGTWAALDPQRQKAVSFGRAAARPGGRQIRRRHHRALTHSEARAQLRVLRVLACKEFE